MPLQPYKFTVVATVQNIDDNGTVTGELETHPAVVFGVTGLTDWAAAFTEKLAAAEQP